MNKRAMIALAASAALVPVATMAQTVPDPDASYGLPAMSLAAASAASAQAAPRPMPPARVGMPAHHNPGMGPHIRMMHPRGMGHGQRHVFTRIHRGGSLPHFWFGRQFQVRNWGLYGFPPPVSGGRWIRYYDDALLIDGYGRVLDGRYGMDWDRYGERWSYGDDGAPYYADEDYDRDDEWSEDDEDDRGDYADGDHHGRTTVRVERRNGHRGAPPPPPGYGYGYGPPPPPPGYGYGYGYGYRGYGYGGGVWIVTETTVTTPPVVEMRTVYRTVTERVRVAPRKVHRCRCAPPPPPRPRPGERG